MASFLFAVSMLYVMEFISIIVIQILASDVHVVWFSRDFGSRFLDSADGMMFGPLEKCPLCEASWSIKGDLTGAEDS